MQARIENPAMTLPGALEAFRQLRASITSAGIPDTRQITGEWVDRVARAAISRREHRSDGGTT